MIKSISTIKADAAQRSFAAFGEGIVWAVLSSGIDSSHPHFARHANLVLDAPLEHLSFGDESTAGAPLVDDFGHGTGCGGVIAGAWTDATPRFVGDLPPVETTSSDRTRTPITSIGAMAPMCKLVSMKVLDRNGTGRASAVIDALQTIRKINGGGRQLIHGVNLSLSYPVDEAAFACGQTPLCQEVNRLADSGVVVVASAGNAGSGYLSTQGGTKQGGHLVSIGDPGNAEKAITVGSTSREQPLKFGVSYFSSKGPTADGRRKPDLVAPGERIITCAAGSRKNAFHEAADPALPDIDYVTDTGTSIAAAHVSGAIAAFLSVRPGYIGDPQAVKDLFLATALDLERDPSFQGRGLVDLLAALSKSSG